MEIIKWIEKRETLCISVSKRIRDYVCTSFENLLEVRMMLSARRKFKILELTTVHHQHCFCSIICPISYLFHKYLSDN